MEDYKAPWFLFNGHLQTIYPAFFRRSDLKPSESVEIPTPDDDFLDLDCYRAGKSSVVIISHGLEGNSSRPYVKGMVSELLAAGYDVVCWNYRGCSGKLNRQPILYHSGATYDLRTVVEWAAAFYHDIYLVGFSLGGNLTLKYLGEGSVHSGVRKASAISAPLDLKSGALHMSKGFNRVYERRFLRSLGQKIRSKHRQYPETYPLDPLKKIKTIYEFDDVYTSKIHGFRDAEDYYHQCSSKNYLADITVPTLILNAQNDPLLPTPNFDPKLLTANPRISPILPESGGHCGFPVKNQGSNWCEITTSAFFDKGI